MTNRAATWIVFESAVLIAVASATDHAGGWNDASRLATIECLVDHHTWVIDQSVFVQVPALDARPHPFGNDASSFPNGTQDKLLIDGHYYSDKSPVLALLLAGPYYLWRLSGGPSAAERPDWFCWYMSLCSSGLAYVIAVLCVSTLAIRFRLQPTLRLLMVAAFGLATLALPYARSTNNHEMLLGMTMLLLVVLDQLESSKSFALAGTIAGLAYTTDLGAGPVLCGGTALYASWRCLNSKSRDWSALAVFFMTMLPWLALHHSLNYYIGGTWRPANANPEFFRWPGCPFDAGTMSGAWNHSSVVGFLGYALDLLVGKKGFWPHNLPLLIVLPNLIALMARPHQRRELVWLCLAWSVGVWLIYAAGSRNYSGACVSVRWYVPLVAPFMYLTMLTLCDRPRLVVPFAWLSICGFVINALAWWRGPWSGTSVPGYWLVAAVGVLGAIWFSRASTRRCDDRPALARAA